MYQVKLFDAKGKLKRIIPPEELVMLHWCKFRNKSFGKLGIGNGGRKKPIVFD